MNVPQNDWESYFEPDAEKKVHFKNQGQWNTQETFYTTQIILVTINLFLWTHALKSEWTAGLHSNLKQRKQKQIVLLL